jgi:hypothetical protein
LILIPSIKKIIKHVEEKPVEKPKPVQQHSNTNIHQHKEHNKTNTNKVEELEDDEYERQIENRRYHNPIKMTIKPNNNEHDKKSNDAKNIKEEVKGKDTHVQHPQEPKKELQTNINNTKITEKPPQHKDAPKYSMQSLLRDGGANAPKEEEPKKKDPIVTLKMDPNSTDIKDMKIGVNMDGETAYKLYQDNKQYLPSKEQMLNGASKSADFMAQNSDVITGSKGDPTKKKAGFFDPLTSLFGAGKKTDGGSSSQSSNTTSKKGQF